MEIRSSCFPPFRRISSRKANRDAGIIETSNIFRFLSKYYKYKKHSSAKKRTECRRMPHSQQEPELKLHENINFN